MAPQEKGSSCTYKSFLQSALWLSFKSSFGWKAFTFLFKDEPLNVLVRRFRGGFSLAYLPYAPSEKYRNDMGEISLFLKKKLPSNSVFIRYDLPWHTESEGFWPDAPCGFRKAPADIQPPSTVLLDISLSEEELLKNMKPKTRYNIRLADKKGVVVSGCGVEKLSVWYGLYEETAARDKISIHGFDYYKKLFELADREKEADLRLYLASAEGDVIAGIIVLFYGKEAVYLYGASCGRKRETMPAYALQWRAIRDAKKAGCSEYDFFGISPSEDPSHPMYGLYRFKTGFGGKIVHRPGCWDFPCRPFLYMLYCKAESLRRFYYKKLKKR